MTDLDSLIEAYGASIPQTILHMVLSERYAISLSHERGYLSPHQAEHLKNGLANRFKSYIDLTGEIKQIWFQY